jgi:hypothetical protein
VNPKAEALALTISGSGVPWETRYSISRKLAKKKIKREG